MAVLIQRTFYTVCPSELIEFINNDSSITPELLQIIVDTASGSPLTSDFWFDSALSGPETIAFDAILSTWTCESNEGDVIGPNGERICDACPAAPDIVWSSLKVLQDFSKRNRICIRHNDIITQAFQQTYVNIQFDTDVRTDPGYYTYDSSDGSITVVNEGWYLIMAGIAVEATSTSRNSSVAELRIGGGTVNGGKAYGFHYADQSAQTLAARGIVHLTANQKIQVFVARDWGKSTLQTLPESCRITVISMDDIPSGSPPV